MTQLLNNISQMS